MQDKSGRYFFRDTFSLSQGEIYVSPFDLNIERDQLEVPYKPMIRFGIPVFDIDGRKRGVILINYLGRSLLQDFHRVMQGGDPRIAMLLNRDGYWLSSPQAQDEWGFMLGKLQRTFGRDFAEEWRIISASEHGVLQTSKGLFVYGTVYPLVSGEYSSVGSALPRAPSQQALVAKDYHWKIVSFVPHSVLSGVVFYNQPAGRILLVATYLLLALVVWMVALISLSRKQVQVELATSKARYDELVRIVPVGVYLFQIQSDGSMAFQYVSPVFCQILGLQADAVLHDANVAFVAAHPDDRDSLTRISQEVSISLKPFRWEGRFIVHEEIRWIRIASDPVPQTGGGSSWCGVVSDITESKQAEEELRKSYEEIEDLYNRAPCGYHSLNENGLIVRINHTELEWFGYSREEVVGKMYFADLLAPASLLTFKENFPRFLKQGYVHDLEFELIRKGGSMLPILVSATAIYGAQGKVVMSRSTLFDLTDRKKLEHELERQARIDVLTGLNNRRHFLELAEQELARARRHGMQLAVLMLDIDYFKRFNDAYGHHVGDMVLKKLSEVCVLVLREIDIFGRLGGEEFAILLPETSGMQAIDAAERLRLAIASAYVPLETGALVHFTVSIGVACFEAADANLDAMLRRADAALYDAKNAGRNQVRGE